MMRYLTYRRFNFIASVNIYAATRFLVDGDYASFALMCLGGSLLSVALEMKARENGQEIEV